MLLTVMSLQDDLVESLFQCLQHTQQCVVGVIHTGQAARMLTHTLIGLDTCAGRHAYRVMELT